MAQTQVQFTPVQVLQAAKRAEAEGKMDYALQFYRHLVEQHGNTPEAQAAREGLFRIAEWRWGEARVTRGREAGAQGDDAAGGPQQAQQPPQPAPGQARGDQRSYQASGPENVSDDYHHAEAAGTLPQIVSRRRAGAQQPAFEPRFRIAQLAAHTLSGIGWLTLLTGIVGVIAAVAGLVAELSAAVMGLPLGVLVGVPFIVIGLALAVSGQVASAIFDGTNAALERAAVARGQASY
ncbi:MAG TPA: hypothetical protein VFF87_11690 [Hyphomicrobium sp.]|nr:hypothetical protein [Hyphomicrobium sp.]